MDMLKILILLGCIVIIGAILNSKRNKKDDAGKRDNEVKEQKSNSKKHIKMYRVYSDDECNEDGLPIDKNEPFSYIDTAYNFANIRTIYEINRVKPNEGWELAYVGICKVNGKFYLVNMRQRSYGAFLGSEEDVKEISFSEFYSMAKEKVEGITEDNALSFIPNDFCKIDMPTPVSKKIERGRFSPNKDQIKVLYIREELRFGSYVYELRKFDTGYRIEYINSSSASQGRQIYNRLISDSEFNAICTLISDDFYEKSGELESYNPEVSLYGCKYFAQAELMDGKEIQFADADYVQALTVALTTASQGPIDFEE